MKRINFLSVAVAIAALSSCQSDDLDFVGGDVKLASDGSEVFATINDVDGDFTTRAAFAVNAKPGTQTMSQLCLFEEGDQFKMYCSDTWKPQVYKFKQMAGVSAANGSGETAVFEYAGEEGYNAEAVENREYGVFPADLFKFNDEYRKTLVFELPAENAYGAFTPSKAGKDLTGVEGEMSAWHALVPMFGIYKPSTQTVGFYYMTSLIRVQALGLATDQQHTLTLTSSKYKLNGTFTTEEFDAAGFDVETATADNLPEFEQKEAETDAEKSISITFTPSESDVVLYIPLPTGTYETNDLTLKLDNIDITGKLEYRTKEGSSYVYTPLSEVENETLTLDRGVTGTNLYAIVENSATETVASLKDINDLLKKLAEDYDRDVTVDVMIAEGGILVQDLESEKDEYRKLEVPELPYNVTLNINGKITAAEGKKLNIIGGGGNGTLTINYLYNDEQADFAPIAFAENFSNDIVLTTTAKDGKYVKFGGLTAENLTGNLTLEGMFANVGEVKVGKTLTLKNYIHHIGGAWNTAKNAYTVEGLSATTVELEGDCSRIACDKSADAASGNDPNAVVQKESQGTKRTLTFDIKDATITVGKGVEVYGITGAKQVTVSEGVKMGVVGAATVTVAQNAEIGTATTSTSLSIKDAQVDAIVAAGGTVTINAVDKTISTLTLNAPATINLNNGIINTINKTYDYTKGTTTVAKVSSTGASAIGKVESVGNWITFYSKWNGKIMGSGAVDVATQLRDDNIYTANQFMCRNTGPMVLYTDIDFENIDYKRFHVLGSSLTGVVRDDGTTATLKNLKLVKPEGTGYMNIGLYAGTGLGYGTVTVKNIHIENVKAEIKDKVQNVGVLFGKVDGQKAEIENVIVKNASIKCSDESSNIGGLIGYVALNTSIVSTEVDAAIEGYYNLGGIIGSVAKNAEVTFGKTKNVATEGVKAGKTTIKVIKEMTNEKDDHAGKVGLAVGELNGKLSLQYFTATWATNDAENDWKYSKCRFFIDNNTMTFRGCLNGSTVRYYIGYSPDAQEFKLQESALTNVYNGSIYNSVEKNAFNVFKKVGE